MFGSTREMTEEFVFLVLRESCETGDPRGEVISPVECEAPPFAFRPFHGHCISIYSVLRQLVGAGPQNGDDAVTLPPDVHQGLGLSADDAKQFQEQPKGLPRTGAASWLVAIAERISDQSWFILQGDTTPVLTARGTRRGSSWADILLGMVVNRVLSEGNALEGLDMKSAASRKCVPWDVKFQLTPCAEESGTIDLGDLIWADDIATLRVCVCVCV